MKDKTQEIFPSSIGKSTGIRYPVIVDFIERAIASGKLEMGERLPTQRVVANHFGIAIGTVTKAYSEAERRGLIVGKVGRGTYVSKIFDRNVGSSFGGADVPVIDMTMSRPPNEGAARHFANALRVLSKRRDLSDLLGNEPPNGWLRHRAAAAKWISQRGLTVEANQVVACNGVQHALSVIFAAFSRAGDVVVTEELNYPGIRLLAEVYRLRLVGVPIDDEGLQADALEKVCRHQDVKFVLCSPTAHNPTTITMALKRRQQLAHIAQKYNLILIEDDILGMMPSERLPSLSSLCPSRCIYVTGLSKVVATGLRLGFIVAPPSLFTPLMTAVHSTTWMPPPLMLEIFTSWVEDSINEIVAWHRQEILARLEMVKQILGRASYRHDPATYHIWLLFPDLSSSIRFVEMAQLRGVLVLPGKAFTLNEITPSPNAARISFGIPNSRERVGKALHRLTEILVELGI